MWDRDVLSANDIIAETSIELYRWFLKASTSIEVLRGELEEARGSGQGADVCVVMFCMA